MNLLDHQPLLDYWCRYDGTYSYQPLPAYWCKYNGTYFKWIKKHNVILTVAERNSPEYRIVLYAYSIMHLDQRPISGSLQTVVAPEFFLLGASRGQNVILRGHWAKIQKFAKNGWTWQFFFFWRGGGGGGGSGGRASDWGANASHAPLMPPLFANMLRCIMGRAPTVSRILHTANTTVRGRVKKSLQPSFSSSHGCICTKVAVSTSSMNLCLSCHVTWTVLHTWLHYGISIKTIHFEHC